MRFDEYKNEARVTDLMPNNLAYHTIGLVNEAGEVAGKVKKFMRGDSITHDDLVTMLSGELGDLIWYAAMICEDMGISFDQVALSNLEKLADRASRNVIKGNGDER